MKKLKLTTVSLLVFSLFYTNTATAADNFPSDYSCTKSKTSSDYICSKKNKDINDELSLLLVGAIGIIYLIHEYQKSKTDKDTDNYSEKNSQSEKSRFGFSPIFIKDRFQLGLNYKW